MTECFYNKNYLIYSDGGVYNQKYDRWLTGHINSDGYRDIKINSDTFRLHRLVALHYIPNPNNLPEVDHKDGNKLNNDVKNLRWLSHSDNMNAYNKLRPDNKLGFKNIYPKGGKYMFSKIFYKKRFHKTCETLNDALWFKFVYLITQRR